jgi:hypothetical protein
MGLFSQLAGTLSSFFQIGGPNGNGLANNAAASAIEAKDPTNTTLVKMRAAGPAGRNDVTNKTYNDTAANHPLPGTLAFNGGNPLPNNSATEQWYVVTTSGATATVGQLLWDDGSGAGLVTVIPAVTGNTVVTVVALAGATPLAATSLYVWNGATWVLISANAPTPAGVQSMVRVPIATATPVTSATILPVGAVITDAFVDVTTPYSAGATISVGTPVNNTLFQNGTGASPDNDPQAANLYQTQDTPVPAAGGAQPLQVNIAGAPAAGAGFAYILYVSTPLN